MRAPVGGDAAEASRATTQVEHLGVVGGLLGDLSWRVLWPARVIRDEGSVPNNASLVILAERAGGVHEPRAVGGRDELRLDDAEGVVVPEVVGERRLVAVPGELGPLEPLDDQRRDVSLGVAGQLPGV